MSWDLEKMAIARKLMILLCPLLLAGCGVNYSQIKGPPVQVTAADLAPGETSTSDVYAKQRKVDPEGTPRFRGTGLIFVRTTYENPTTNKTEEFVGADCTLDAVDFKADFKSPTHVAVPIYGQLSKPMYVECEAQPGTGNATSLVYNETTRVRNSTAHNGGLLGVLVMAAINEAREDPETDEYKYESLVIPLSE